MFSYVKLCLQEIAAFKNVFRKKIPFLVDSRNDSDLIMTKVEYCFWLRSILSNLIARVHVIR